MVFDSLPILSLLDADGEIDGERYPNFWKLSQEANWYRNASTVSDTTAWAVPSLLTGRVHYGEYPLPHYVTFPQNLFNTLGQRYEVHAFEFVTELCPPSICKPEALSFIQRIDKFRGLLSDVSILYQYSLSPPELTEDLACIHPTFGGFAEGNKPQDLASAKIERPSPKSVADAFMESIQECPNPQLFFMHILAPHAPWRYLPSGKKYGNGHYAKIHGLNGVTKNWERDLWAINVAYQRHLLQTAYVDRIIGQTVKSPKDKGLYDETMLIIVSDHGSSYKLKGDHRRLTEANKTDIVRIPMFIKYPHQRSGGADDRDASVVDILPTIFDQLKIKTEWQLDGNSLKQEPVPARAKKVIHGSKGERFEVESDHYRSSTAVADKLKLLATGENIDSLFNISLYPSLNGSRVSAMTIMDSDDEILIHNPREFENVNLNSDYLPAFVSGRAPGLKNNAALAIVLNEKIITVTKVFLRSPSTDFSLQ